MHMHAKELKIAQGKPAHGCCGGLCTCLGPFVASFKNVEVVQRLLRENNVLRWDPVDRSYIVLDGAKFEDRFNHLRKTRQKHKDGSIFFVVVYVSC